MKGLFFILTMCLCGLWLPSKAHAYTNWCYPQNNMPYSPVYNFGNKIITNPDEDSPGKEYVNAYTWNLDGSIYASCDCNSRDAWETYYFTETHLPQNYTGGGRTYYQVNDYVQVSTAIWIGGGVGQYIQTPFPSGGVSNKAPMADNCYLTNDWHSGSKGQLSLRISKSFIGTSIISNVQVVSVFATAQSGSYGHGPIPISNIYLSGQITVPQTCTINAGQIVTVDFGDIWSGKFKNKGQKPDGVNAKTVTFPVTCNGGVESTANLTVRFQSTPDANYPDAISSDNPDVGVVITDTNGRTVEPNTGLIPFSLENSQATVSFKAYPVSTTGKAPTEGKFTSLAYIRVDFA